jgi:Protein of unknown function (DUF1826)
MQPRPQHFIGVGESQPGSNAPTQPSFRPHFPRSFSHSATIAGLERIFDDAISICIWRRPVDAAIKDYLAQLAPVKPVERLLRLDAAAPRLDALAQDLPERPGRESFLEDLFHLVELFSTVTDSNSLGLRFTITQRALCPRFHADGVGMRLICTWQGAGTEWLEHASVDRAYLGAGAGGLSDEASGLMLPGAQIYRMRPFEVGLFKGDAYPDNAGRGAVHRSPPADGTAVWRVMATLDDVE